MDERTYVTRYSNYNDVPTQEKAYAHGTNQHANWGYIVETTTVEHVRVPASGYTNFSGGRKKNEFLKEYMPAYAPNNYHEGYEINYGPVYESSGPPNFQEHEDVMNNFLEKLQLEASRLTKPSNNSGPNRYTPTIPNNNRPKTLTYVYPLQDTHLTQNFPGPNRYKPSSPTKYRPSSPIKYRPSSPIKYRSSDPNRYPLSGPTNYPSNPPKYRPSSPTKYRPSSPIKYHHSSPNKYRPSDLNRYQPSSLNKYPSSPPKYRPSSPPKYRSSSPIKYQPSSPNKYRPSDVSKYQISGPNKYPSSPPKYRPSSPIKYGPSSPNKYRPSSPTKYRSSSPSKYHPSSPIKYKPSSPNKYRPTSPNTYQPASLTQNYPSKGGHLNVGQNIRDPNMFRSTSPINNIPSKGPSLDTERLYVPNKHQPSTQGGKIDGVGAGPKNLWQSIGLPTTRHPVMPPTNNIDEVVSYQTESGNHSPRSEPNRVGEFDHLSPHVQPVQTEKPNPKPTFGGGIARRFFRSNTIDSQEAIKKYGGASVP
uniref:adhesive plaque matrix protein-like n=1 Tax=Erigeron canadensis TaxID=72917 RepID=UPI001CB8D8B6|nr:adhesive plaque matrix protein-like [Erigeron canadensis]